MCVCVVGVVESVETNQRLLASPDVGMVTSDWPHSASEPGTSGTICTREHLEGCVLHCPLLAI